MTSRVDKMLRELGQRGALSDAHRLREHPVTLIVAQHADPVMVRSAVALALRCFDDRVIVAGADGTVPSPLAIAAEREAAEYGAHGRVQVGLPPVGLVIGLSCNPGGQIFVDADAWSAATNVLLPRARKPAAPAASYAVAAGFAKLFASLLGRSERIVNEQHVRSLLDFREQPRDHDVPDDAWLGEVALIGAGAIGSGVLHTLRLSNWVASVEVCDPQRYDEPNHETTLVISKDDAIRQRPKAATLGARSQRPGLKLTHTPERITSEHALLAKELDALICAVDNSETRRMLDMNRAKVLLNAAVGNGREDGGHVLWTRHAHRDARLSGYYPEGDAAEADASENPPPEVAADECSRIAYDGIALAAPFMGMAAGALLVSGLVQHATAIDSGANYLKIDLFALQGRATAFLRQRNADAT